MVLRSIVLMLTLLCAAGSCAQEKPAVGAAPAKPNIVVILADDLGNADLGYRGSDIKTPNLDKLATGGVRLESFYGMPVCTPSRAALMTGRYAMRYGLQTLVIFPSHTYGLATDERTLPQALKEAGYNTAMVGKWHLGHGDRKYWPQNRGFDHFYGNLVGEVDYFKLERGGVIDWQRNGTFLKEEGYHTTLVGNEAVKLIEAPRRCQTPVPVHRLPGTSCPLPGAPGVYRPLQGHHRRPGAPHLRGHDHRPGRPGGPHCNCPGKEGYARQHPDRVQLRQRGAHQRPVRHRGAVAGGAGGERRGGVG